MRTLHPLIREIHLLSGLFLAVVILFYAISGAMIAYAPWLPGAGVAATTERIPLPVGAGASPEALQIFVEQELGPRGRVVGPEPTPAGGLLLRYTRPGGTVEVTTTPGQSELVVVTTRHGWIRTLRGLHVLTGYAGGPAFVAWSLLLDFTALAVIGFALSGIYLWYKLSRRRRLGWLMLGSSWLYTLGVIVYFWFG
jgi:hypothetical protein